MSITFVTSLTPVTYDKVAVNVNMIKCGLVDRFLNFYLLIFLWNKHMTFLLLYLSRLHLSVQGRHWQTGSICFQSPHHRTVLCCRLAGVYWLFLILPHCRPLPCPCLPLPVDRSSRNSWGRMWKQQGEGGTMGIIFLYFY